ncbi:MAG: hypothetical protein ABWY05_11870 [Noviherbaspirillum sp.]
MHVTKRAADIPLGRPLRSKLALLVSAIALASCGGSDKTSGGEQDRPERLFRLTRSSEGIAEIQVPTMAAASAGVGYAYA